jgi:hypothetical protein
VRCFNISRIRMACMHIIEVYLELYELHGKGNRDMVVALLGSQW